MSRINRVDDLGSFFSTCARLISPAYQHTGQPLYRPQMTWRAVPPRDPLLRRIAQTFRTWRERARVRRELSALDDHVLKDIGLTRAQVEAEGRKPVWRV